MFDPATIPTLLAYGCAFACGTLIGLERQWRQRNAGLRTNVLVALGAAAFVNLGYQTFGPDGATRIIAYVVSGIGFLGAGVILKDGTQIRGLNTAATLWCSAAVGALSGAARPLQAVLLTAFVLAGNTLLRPLVNWINRRPVSLAVTEALYAIHVTGRPSHIAELRDLIDEVLERAHYPMRGIEIETNGEHLVELVADLVPITVAEAELDAVVDELRRSPEVLSATWSAETTG